jgi:hypothetical protein
MLGFLGNMTSAPCCVTMGLSRFLSNATIETETFLWLWRCDLETLLMNLSVVSENEKRLDVFGALLIVINSCVLNFECNKIPS